MNRKDDGEKTNEPCIMQYSVTRSTIVFIHVMRLNDNNRKGVVFPLANWCLVCMVEDEEG